MTEAPDATGATYRGQGRRPQSAPRIHRYDVLLAVIPLAFALALVAALLASVPLQGALAMASLLGGTAIVHGVYVDPPVHDR